MRSIPPLNFKDHKLFADIAEAKQGNRGALMSALMPTAKAAYADYSKVAPAVDTLKATTLTEGQAGVMKHAYDVATAPFTKARGKLLGRVVATVCPFCNVGESNTLDHYPVLFTVTSVRVSLSAVDVRARVLAAPFSPLFGLRF